MHHHCAPQQPGALATFSNNLAIYLLARESEGRCRTLTRQVMVDMWTEAAAVDDVPCRYSDEQLQHGNRPTLYG